MNPINTLRLILSILSLSLIISSAESFTGTKIYKTSGWLNWDRLKYDRPVFRHPLVAPLLNWLFPYPKVLILIIGRLICSIWLLVAVWANWNYTLLIILLTIINILFSLRNAFSNNGADQLTNVILIAAVVACMGAGNEAIVVYSLFFIALQSSLAYFTSGINKINRNWLNGVYLKDVLSTNMFGNPLVFRKFRKMRHAFWSCSLLMIFGELLLAFCMLFPSTISVYILAGGFVFHLIVAYIMGFNTFLFTFLSTYPAISFVSFHRIRF